MEFIALCTGIYITRDSLEISRAWDGERRIYRWGMNWWRRDGFVCLILAGRIFLHEMMDGLMRGEILGTWKLVCFSNRREASLKLFRAYMGKGERERERGGCGERELKLHSPGAFEL